jgi:hypothetical protein
MDWTGTRLRSSEGRGELILAQGITGPYARGDVSVTDFVTRYAHAAMARLSLHSVLVKGADGEVLGEVLPPPKPTHR